MKTNFKYFIFTFADIWCIEKGRSTHKEGLNMYEHLLGLQNSGQIHMYK